MADLIDPDDSAQAIARAGSMTATLRHDANDEDPHVMSALNAGIERDPPPTTGVLGTFNDQPNGGP